MPHRAGPTSKTQPASNVIVVGIDGSASSHAALDSAIAEASFRRSELLLVHAWTCHYSGPAVEYDRAYEDARADESHASTDTRPGPANAAGLIVNGILSENGPAAALVDRAESADLIVVGSHSSGAVRSMLLGSVAHAVTEQATCPTVVVH